MNPPNLIPASLIRVRCFINTTGRFKVKPWATAGETLDAFSDTLIVQRDNEKFWTGLEDLLEKLTSDMRKRIASRGSAIDNEVLDPSQHHALLSEIRNALAPRGHGSFNRLAATLSVPACGLLLLLGGLVTLGCGSTENIDGRTDASADVARDTSADTLDTTDPVDPPHDPGCEHSGLTLEQIADTCLAGSSNRDEIMECIADLNDSWRSGLREYFECMHCDGVDYSLLHCLLWGYPDVCTDPSSAGEFDLDAFFDRCSVLLYLGVSFE